VHEDEDETTALEVKVFEGAEVLLLKLTCYLELGLVDFGVECVDVGGTFLQGNDTVGYDDYGSGWQLEVCSFGYVKREYGVSSCDGEIW
jgi:hypothetical protein